MALRTLSTAALRRELARREAGVVILTTRRKRLAALVAAMDAELARLGVDSAPKRRGRPPSSKAGRRGPGRPKGSKNKRHAKRDGRSRRVKNAMTLLQAILQRVPLDKTVSPAEAAAAARAAGYKSAGQNFGQQVAVTLAKAKEFRKVGRGQYVRKGGAMKAAQPAKRGRKARRKPGRPKGNKAKPAAAKPEPAAA